MPLHYIDSSDHIIQELYSGTIFTNYVNIDSNGDLISR
jgi:hypothetical protein